MKNFVRILACLTLAVPLTLFAAEQTVLLNVAGKCGSCKKRIESAAESVEGVKDATWDKKKKVLKAVYEDTKTNDAAIRAAILKVGYDVDSTAGAQEAYDKLPECCQYRSE